MTNSEKNILEYCERKIYEYSRIVRCRGLMCSSIAEIKKKELSKCIKAQDKILKKYKLL